MSNIEDLGSEREEFGDDDQDEGGSDGREDDTGGREMEGGNGENKGNGSETGCAVFELAQEGVTRNGEECRQGGWIRHVAQRTQEPSTGVSDIGAGLDGLIRAIGLDKAAGWRAAPEVDTDGEPLGGHGHRRKRRPTLRGDESPTSGAVAAESTGVAGVIHSAAFSRGGSGGSSGNARRPRRRSRDGSSSDSDAGEGMVGDASFASERDAEGSQSRRRGLQFEGLHQAADNGPTGTCESPAGSSSSSSSGSDGQVSILTGGDEDDNGE